MKPDYDSVVLERVTLPYSKFPYLNLTYSDPKLKDYSLITLADSLPESYSKFSREDNAVGLDAKRLTSFILRYPRYIHAEYMTHRVLSRNASSSRARSVLSTIREVMENPIHPLFTVNKAGMTGEFASPEARELQLELWLLGRDKAVATALSLLIGKSLFDGRTDSEIASSYEEVLSDYYENGYDKQGNAKAGYLSTHKQQMNRVLEPYSSFEIVTTGSYWSNFINLRNHPDAQPEIKAVGNLVQHALTVNDPQNSWIHLPFIGAENVPSMEAPFEQIRDFLMLSSTEAAQISYRDKSQQTKSTATLALGERLLSSEHLSPFEHPAIDKKAYKKLAKANELPTSKAQLSSNFDKSWVQFRPILSTSDKYKR